MKSLRCRWAVAVKALDTALAEQRRADRGGHGPFPLEAFGIVEEGGGLGAFEASRGLEEHVRLEPIGTQAWALLGNEPVGIRQKRDGGVIRRLRGGGAHVGAPARGRLPAFVASLASAWAPRRSLCGRR